MQQEQQEKMNLHMGVVVGGLLLLVLFGYQQYTISALKDEVQTVSELKEEVQTLQKQASNLEGVSNELAIMDEIRSDAVMVAVNYLRWKVNKGEQVSEDELLGARSDCVQALMSDAKIGGDEGSKNEFDAECQQWLPEHSPHKGRGGGSRVEAGAIDTARTVGHEFVDNLAEDPTLEGLRDAYEKAKKSGKKAVMDAAKKKLADYLAKKSLEAAPEPFADD